MLAIDAKPGQSGGVHAVSRILVLVGLFTVSWDRFLVVNVAGFNVKVCTAAFALAFALTVFDNLRQPKEPGNRQALVAVSGLVLLAYAVMCFFAQDRVYALAQWVTVLIGAVLPFLAVYLNARVFGRIDVLLTAFIRGGVFASIYGLYQLLAFYTHLPQGVVYLDTSGGFGRISSFSYESGYFGYFLVMILGALFARAALEGKPVHRGQLVFFLVVLLLTNSRASLVAFPLFLIFLFFRRPKNVRRARIMPIVVIALYAAVIAALLAPGAISQFSDRALTIFDPNEQSSNAPRLILINMGLQIVRDHLFVGIGPGNLILYSAQYGVPVPVGQTSNSWIINDVWLQALLDGGILLLAVEVLFVGVAIRTLFRRRVPASRLLMTGWMAAFFVSSIITSYFFDMELWVVLGMAAALSASRPPAPMAVSPGALRVEEQSLTARVK